LPWSGHSMGVEGCVQCGACCKNITGKAKEIFEDITPYRVDSTGKCEKLTVDNKCSVFSSRPAICNSKELWKGLYSTLLTWKDYRDVCKEACLKQRKDS
jgi:Fe-S-cluster containining protein